MSAEIKTAFLLSGKGTSVEAALRARKRGELDGIRPVAVIASRPDTAGIERADAFGVPTYVLHRAQYSDAGSFGGDLLKLLDSLHVDLISQNGWIPKTPFEVVAAYRGHIMNQHPGPLDPGRIDFGGKDMYGPRVSAARLAYTWLTGDPKEHFTEATIHQVTEEYDKGNLIAVSRLEFPGLGRAVTIADLAGGGRDVWKAATQELQGELFPLEHDLVVTTLREIGSSWNIPEYVKREALVPDAYVGLAQEAKSITVQLFP